MYSIYNINCFERCDYFTERKISKPKQTVGKNLNDIAKSKDFRATCISRNLPELSKCIICLTNPNSSAKDISKNQENFAKKSENWNPKKSKTRHSLLAVIYIMIKNYKGDSKFYDDKPNILSELEELLKDKNFAFNSFESVIKPFRHADPAMLKTAIDKFVNAINTNSTKKLEVFNPAAAETPKSKPKTNQEKGNTSQLEIKLLLPDNVANTKQKYNGYMDLFKHPTLPDTIFGTQIKISNQPENIVFLIPAFREIIAQTNDDSKLTWMRLAIEQLQANKKMFLCKVPSKRYVTDNKTPIEYKDTKTTLTEDIRQLDLKLQSLIYPNN